MGLFEAVRSTALRGKVNAELALLQTKLSRLPLTLGVELYDALEKTTPPPKLLAVIEDRYTTTVQQIKEKRNTKDAKELEFEKVTVHKERTTALQDSATEKTKTWFSDTASQAQLQTSVQLLDREILLLKQEFGKAVYDQVLEDDEQQAQSKTHKIKGKLAKAAAETFGSQPKKDGVTSTLETAFRERASIQSRIEAKNRELQAIADGVR